MIRETVKEKLAESVTHLHAPLDVDGAIARRKAKLRGDFSTDPHSTIGDNLRPAAVLVPLIDHAGGMGVVLTQRTDHLNKHAGQISFPGGRIEEEDKTAVDTALRETEEEIGLARNEVEIVGRLDDYVTGTGFVVAPIVGVVQPPYVTSPDPFEVADIFEVPLDFLIDPSNHKRHSKTFNGIERQFYAMPYEDRYIWGATAAMLVNLYEVLKKT